jgi:hypothetical protein
MIELLCKAIQEKRVLIILYKGQGRIIEPHLTGQKRSGNDALSAWQVGGYSESNRQPPWRNYLLSEIENIQVLDQFFDNPREGFNPNDKTMSHIYCHV